MLIYQYSVAKDGTEIRMTIMWRGYVAELQ